MNITLKANKNSVGSHDKIFVDPQTHRYFEINKTHKNTWIIEEYNGSNAINFRAHVATLKEVKESLQQELCSVNAI
jgi:hypothetical protein